MQHPITPPPELVQQWRHRWTEGHGEFGVYLATQAARWGADQEADAPAAVAERPSDEDLGLIYHDCCRGCEFMDQVGFEDAARAVLARWGQPPVPPAERHAAPVPVAVTERLPLLAPQGGEVES